MSGWDAWWCYFVLNDCGVLLSQCCLTYQKSLFELIEVVGSVGIVSFQPDLKMVCMCWVNVYVPFVFSFTFTFKLQTSRVCLPVCSDSEAGFEFPLFVCKEPTRGTIFHGGFLLL